MTTTWEFDVDQVPHRDGTYSSTVHIHPEDLKAVCNRWGAQGWDFCETNTGSILLFKRMVSEDAPAWLLDIVADVRSELQDIRNRLDDLKSR